jgi:hypothetical protein
MSPATRRRHQPLRTMVTGTPLIAIAAMLLVTPPAESATTSPKPRLQYGPQVYRLKPTHAKYGDLRRTSYSYAVVYLPTRSVIGDTFEDEGDRSAGDISIGGAFTPNYTQDHLYAKPYGPTRCTVAYINELDNSARELRKLGRIKIGQRVSVTIRPLATALPDVTYGRTYHRPVSMRQGNSFALTETAVQRQLNAIHCKRR